MADAFLDRPDRLGQGQGLLGRGLEEVVGEPLGRLGAEAGELAEGVDQAVEGARAVAAIAQEPPGAGAEQAGQPRDRQVAGERLIDCRRPRGP